MSCINQLCSRLYKKVGISDPQSCCDVFKYTRQSIKPFFFRSCSFRCWIWYNNFTTFIRRNIKGYEYVRFVFDVANDCHSYDYGIWSYSSVIITRILVKTCLCTNYDSSFRYTRVSSQCIIYYDVIMMMQLMISLYKVFSHQSLHFNYYKSL